MSFDFSERAQRIESIQAQALVASVEEATTLVDNTLEAEAEVEYFTGSPRSTLAVLNFDSFSRDLALGVETSETREYIVTIRGFFEARSQSCFPIKITLAGRPKNSSESTLLHSLGPFKDSVRMSYRDIYSLPTMIANIGVLELSQFDRQR